MDFAAFVPDYLKDSNLYSVVVTDLDGNYVFVNNFFKKRFSFLQSSFIGESSLTAIYEEDHLRCRETVALCFQNPDKTIRVRLRKPDTTPDDFYWTEWEFSVLKDENRQPLGVMCIGYDLTETERASRLAQEFAQRVETIIERITDGFFVIDRNWKFIKINQIAAEVLCTDKSAIIGKSFWDFYPDTEAYRYPQKFREAMNENKAVYFEDFRPDIQQWYSAAAYPSEEGLTIFFRNITQEREARARLEDSEKKLQALFNSSRESHVLVSPLGIILSFNKVAEKIAYSFFKKELKEGINIKEVLPPNSIETYERILPQTLAGKTTTIQLIRHLEDIPVWFEVTYRPVYDKKNQILGISINTLNIDEKKRAEEKIKKQNEILKQIAWEQSHKVRQPLASIMGLVGLLTESGTSFSGDEQTYLRHLQEAAEQLDQIIHSIVSKTEGMDIKPPSIRRKL
ncbi:PAS domain-containing protein [Hugenholtzia roseola]|uniref:PAS domain-containing protein n=1 Tax=Hugenholtzia roseola TaxID=1002 RepID=UPI000425329D|nr:PAS domain-containing protein [Hugenholtzia roseola]